MFGTGKLKTVDMIKAGFGLNIITMLVSFSSVPVEFYHNNGKILHDGGIREAIVLKKGIWWKSHSSL